MPLLPYQTRAFYMVMEDVSDPFAWFRVAATSILTTIVWGFCQDHFEDWTETQRFLFAWIAGHVIFNTVWVLVAVVTNMTNDYTVPCETIFLLNTLIEGNFTK